MLFLELAPGQNDTVLRNCILKNKLDLFVIVFVRLSYGVGDPMVEGEYPPVDLVNTSSK